ncbi:autotransporter domain-containing protein [Lawsonia intracellularis]|uniref:NA n=3 Tax=Lawsonia intracellularis TaxID=29546 RepID=Q1MNU1_LAWIP|nr:hypothetical protein LAW_30039 [Lawsonia intracellularis N343]KAA0204140.1 autotransporter domain-containing protein [Lawsonia intracellularis]CAJ53992.1 NA [Lawsonia intracellularis PHE/MN1-00]MBZ3893250.1 autotransporter domain-containing protein [Lawsonia intracellularis]RBN31896.1 autotransporter domain-containing protein [Lawsonia intracellularis]
MEQILKFFLYFYILFSKFIYEVRNIYIYDLQKIVLIQFFYCKKYTTIFYKTFIIVFICSCVYIFIIYKYTFATDSTYSNNTYESQDEILSEMSMQLELSALEYVEQQYIQQQEQELIQQQLLQQLMSLYGQLGDLENQAMSLKVQQQQLSEQYRTLLHIPIVEQSAETIEQALSITHQQEQLEEQVNSTQSQIEVLQEQILQTLYQLGMIAPPGGNAGQEEDGFNIQGPGGAGGIATFTHGYGYLDQFRSLQGLQYVLFDTSSHVSHALRDIVSKIQMSSNFSKVNTIYLPQDLRRHKKFHRNTKVVEKKEKLHYFLYPITFSCNLFTSLEEYNIYLDKQHSTQVGIVVNPIPNVTMGFSYNYKDLSNKYKIVETDTSINKVNTKSNITKFLATVAWNTDGQGFTGFFSSCYGWGHIKTIRSFNPSGTSFKGNSEATIYGALVRLGYNVRIVEDILLTPYVEGVMSIVERKPYEEQRGYLLSKINNNKEVQLERGIGITSFWKCTYNSALQTWLGFGLNTCKINKLTSRLSYGPFYLCSLSVPSVRKTSFWKEIGMSYDIQLSDRTHINISGNHRLEADKQPGNSSIRMHLQYNF